MMAGAHLLQMFKVEWFHTATDGTVTLEHVYTDRTGLVIDPTLHDIPVGQWTIMKIGTYEQVVDLVQRKQLYKEFKINKIDWMLYKDDLANSASGSQSAVSYYAAWDKRHSKLFRNPEMNCMPDPPLTTTDPALVVKYQAFIMQQPGVMIPTINGQSKSLSCPANCVTRRVLYAEGSTNPGASTEVPITVMTKFPWINLERDLAVMPQVGECTAFVPMVVIRLNSNTNLPLASAVTLVAPAWKVYFLEVLQKFQWMYRAKIHWSVRGKHYECSLATAAAELSVGPGEDTQ